MSLFISFEGGEGSGKSTQAELLAQRLQQNGAWSMLVREPGTTPLGWYLRNWLKRQGGKKRNVSQGAELFLFAAARAEFVSKVLKPALGDRNRVSIADRYGDSTTAYQGYGRQLPLSDVAIINNIASQGIIPDVTFLMDCSPEEGLKRVGSVQISLPLETNDSAEFGRLDKDGARRFEEEALGFHRRVREGYLELARQDPDRWCVLDATRTVEEISDIIWGHVWKVLSSDTEENTLESDIGLPLWTQNLKNEDIS